MAPIVENRSAGKGSETKKKCSHADIKILRVSKGAGPPFSRRLIFLRSIRGSCAKADTHASPKTPGTHTYLQTRLATYPVISSPKRARGDAISRRDCSPQNFVQPTACVSPPPASFCLRVRTVSGGKGAISTR